MQIKNRQQLLIMWRWPPSRCSRGTGWCSRPDQGLEHASQAHHRAAPTDYPGKMLVQREQSVRSRWEQMSRNALTNNTSAAEQKVFQAIDLWAQDSGVTVSSITPQWKHDSDDYTTYECAWTRPATSGS